MYFWPYELHRSHNIYTLLNFTGRGRNFVAILTSIFLCDRFKKNVVKFDTINYDTKSGCVNEYPPSFSLFFELNIPSSNFLLY